ncbi:translation initiation factor IF-1 [Candidatus Vidania fulgoroideae]|nr:translation initiation factor IF-1 [Candidatus Vidania fulgoroideae]
MCVNKKITLEAQVTQCLPNTLFIVKTLNSKKKIICHLSGKMRINYIKILVGDIVKVETYKNDMKKGRIIYRLK